MANFIHIAELFIGTAPFYFFIFVGVVFAICEHYTKKQAEERRQRAARLRRIRKIEEED